MACKSGDFSYHPECKNCPLHESATHVGIGGRGHDNPTILFIGVAPGGEEDSENRPFVGRSGDLLQQAINEYITVPWRVTNLVRCRPWVEEPGSWRRKDRDPTTEEIKACAGYLYEEITTTKPKILVPLGDVVLKALMGKNYKIKDWRGIPIEKDPWVIVPIYHPSFIVRNITKPTHGSISNKDAWVLDIQRINRLAVEGEAPELTVKIHYPKTEEEFEEMLNRIDQFEEVSFDIETNSYDGADVTSIWSPGAKIISCACAVSDTEAWAWPVHHKELEYPWIDNFMMNKFIPLLRRKKIIAQNGKFDMEGLWIQWRANKVYPTWDTMLMHYLLDETSGRQSLEDQLKSTYPELVKEKSAIQKYASEIKKCGYEAIPLKDLLRYNAYDTIGAYRLKTVHLKALEEDSRRLRLYKDVIIPGCEALIQMEIEGVTPDLVEHERLLKEIEGKRDEFKEKLQKIAEAYGMQNFNPNSVPQTARLLFEKIGIPILGKTKGGAASTKDDFLMNARSKVTSSQREVIDLIISHIDDTGEETGSYRKYDKLLGTYIKPFKSYIGFDGKIHANYNQAGTVTLRLSCNEPNLQNQPKMIRGLFTAPEDYWCVEFDYSQAELRALTVLCQDPGLVEVYQKGLDLHTVTAKKIFNLPEGIEPTSTQRRIAKNTNFGIVFSQGAEGLSVKLSCSKNKAQEYIDAVLKVYPGIKAYMAAREIEVRQTGQIVCPFGNIRHFPEINSPDNSVVNKAIREAINAPIQSTIGLMTIHKMARLTRIIDWGDCKLLLNQHDALWFMINKDRIDLWIPIIQREMENLQTVEPFGVNFWLPLPVEVKYGPNFKDMKLYEKKEAVEQ